MTLALSSSLGCAINDVGAVQVRWREGEAARIVTLEAWGGHLVLGGGDSSMTVGHSRRTYVFPLADRAPAWTSLAEVRSRATLRPMVCDPCPSLWELGMPLARDTRTEGLVLDFNDSRVGVALGARARTALRIDGGTRAMTMYLDAERADGGAAWIGEGQP